MSFAVEALVVVTEPLLSALHIDRHDDDLLDRLNHKATTCLMFFLIFVQTFYQLYLDKSIHCWSPAEFPDSWVDYTNSYCWIRNTYYLAPDQLHIPHQNSSMRRNITYYQWVPYILCYLGIVSYAPALCWYNIGSRISGLNIHEVVTMVRTRKVSLNPFIRDRKSAGIAKHMDRALKISHMKQQNSSGLWKLLPSRCVMTLVWIITKLLYIAASALQIYSCTLFLGEEFMSYGYMVIRELFLQQGDSIRNTMFPSSTLCDFEVRDVKEHKPFTVQCHLPINIFNSRIFVLVWIWLFAMCIINTVGFIVALLKYLPYRRYYYIKSILQSTGEYDSMHDKENLSKFVYDYLGFDGFIALNYILDNANMIVGADVVTRLWKFYTHSQENITPRNSPHISSPTSVRFRCTETVRGESVPN